MTPQRLVIRSSTITPLDEVDSIVMLEFAKMALPFDTIWSPVYFLETQDVAGLITAEFCNDVYLSRGEAFYID